MLKQLFPVCVVVMFSAAVLAQEVPEQQVPEQPMPEQPAVEPMPVPEQPPAEVERPAPEVDIPDDLSTPRSALKVLAEGLERGDADRIREVIHAETEEEERMKEATIEMAEAIGRLRRAAISQWGAEGARPLIGDVQGAMEQGMQRLAEAEEAIEDDTAIVSSPDEATPPMTLKRVDDRWRVPMSEMQPEVSEEELERSVREMGNLAEVIQQFAGQLRQHQTAEEAAQALRSRMMETAMTPEDEELRERPAAERQPPAEEAQPDHVEPEQEEAPQPMPLPQPEQ